MNAFWMAIGFVGQGAFASRFLAQWFASERAGRSVMPVQFWFFSIVGSIFLLVYAIQLRDPVFIVGQSTGMLIYSRNLMLIRKEARAQKNNA
jgi:lipid-A-disaccharide synthase-like uncharacterized protein